MKLSDWLKNTWKHVILDKFIVTPNGNLKIGEINIDLTVGIISTSNKEEFSKLVFHLAPVGTIIDEIPDDYYEGQLLLTRNYLTRKLLTEPSKSYEKYLKVLERRNAEHWADKTQGKQVKVEQTDNNLSVTFDVV